MAKILTPADLLTPLDQSLLNTLLNDATAPCVSVYLPTMRKGADTRENSIRYKRMLQQAHHELARKDAAAADRLLGGLEAIAEDEDFWQHQMDALAVFADGSGRQMLVKIPRPVAGDGIAAVADSFHVKPILRVLQQPGRYQLLAVSQKHVTLYEGDRDRLDVVPLNPDVPKSIVEALGGQLDDANASVNRGGSVAHSGMIGGGHDNRDERDAELERFFRVVDKAVYDYHGRRGDLPLYLAADVDYHARFQKASHHPRLQKEGVRINPDAVEVNTERLRKEMEAIITPAADAQTAEMVEQYGNAKAQQLGSDDLKKVGEAAAMGRVRLLFIDADQRVGGRVDPTTGGVKLMKETNPDVDDVLDDLAELVLRNGGDVRVLPGDLHPSDTGAAAIFRY